MNNSTIYYYIRTNIVMIVMIVIIYIIYIFYPNITTINSNTITRENMANQSNIPTEATTSLEDSFCRFYDSNDSAINQNEACNKLTEESCMNIKCCTWGKSGATEKCYAGGLTGPTFKTDNEGKKIDIDSYYYMKKCYGNC